MAENAWAELKDQIKQSLPKKASGERSSGEPQPQWATPGKVIFFPVQMRLKDDPEGYSVVFERAMAEGGSTNYESIPGAPEPPTKTIRLQVDTGAGEPFWNISEKSEMGMPVKTDALARRLIERLRDFREEYRHTMIR